MYSVPCQVDRNLASYMSSFGKPVYPLKSVSFIRIDSGNGYHIEARLNAKVIKFVMPKKFAKEDHSKASRKIEFENNLAAWMSDKLNMDIRSE